MADEPVMDQRTADLGTAPLGSLMVKLSIPGMIGMLVMSLYNVVDTFWVSGLKYGTAAVAALTVVFPIQMIAGAVGWGTAAGVTSLVARRFGAGRIREANQAAGNAIAFAFAIGALFALAGLLWAEPLLRLFGAQGEVLAPAVAYLTWVAAGFPFMMLGTVLNAMFRAAGNTVTPMLILASAAVVNAALAPLLIYGVGPFPRLEIPGAALATVISQVVTTMAALYYLRNGRSAYDIHRQDLRPHLPIIQDIAQVGTPATADSWLRSVVACVFNWVLAGFGPAAIAAHGLSLRVMMVVISCLGGGVNQALTPIAGYSFGARDYRRMWRAYRIAAVWTGGGGLLLGGAVCLFARQILAPFARDPELLRLGALSLQLKMCTFFLVEPQMMAVFTLQGMGMGGRAMVITTSRNVVLVVPAVILLSSWFGVTGAFSAQAVADVLAVLVTVAVLLPVYRRYSPSPISVPYMEEVDPEAAGG